MRNTDHSKGRERDMEPRESEAEPGIQCFQRESVVFVKLVVDEMFGIV